MKLTKENYQEELKKYTELHKKIHQREASGQVSAHLVKLRQDDDANAKSVEEFNAALQNETIKVTNALTGKQSQMADFDKTIASIGKTHQDEFHAVEKNAAQKIAELQKQIDEEEKRVNEAKVRMQERIQKDAEDANKRKILLQSEINDDEKLLHLNEKVREDLKAWQDAKAEMDKVQGVEVSSTLGKGSFVFFGNYPQSNGTEKQPITWQILDIVENKVLLISESGLDCQRYNKQYADISWENCSLRKWLNNDFLRKAFSKEEQKKIQVSKVSADKNPQFPSAEPGNETEDKIFLLSIDEVKKYFAEDDASLQCPVTPYAEKQKAYKDGNGNCWWWLRTPGGSTNRAANVNTSGIYLYGYRVADASYAVRPAIWIDLESLH